MEKHDAKRVRGGFIGSFVIQGNWATVADGIIPILFYNAARKSSRETPTPTLASAARLAWQFPTRVSGESAARGLLPDEQGGRSATIRNDVVLVEQIEPRIIVVRGHKVLLDKDLADVYGVTTKRLNQQVRRNRKRFPEDFLFQLTAEEYEVLRLQNATSKTGRGGARYKPFAFTEHGAIMAASVLNTKRAIEVSVFVVRAFVKIRDMVGAHKLLSEKLLELERRIAGHDQDIRALVAALRQLAAPPPPPRAGRIGFGREQER